MASAPPSPLASSVEKTNGAKLSRLLIDGGTTVLKNVFDGYHPPANLAADLNANYLALDNLLRRRVLRPAQWDLLFPPSGVPPDSNNFDITLLFLLLTNICGLFPPLSGWHTKPPPTDTSLEANLARIKFYRNELYGHVSTTSVDSPTFNSLWQEISAVVVALGLNQAEIGRLKAEHCGEEDYLDVLRDWADSEEDIKSQLKGIRQDLTETQQDVEEVQKNQLEDRKTMEDTKSKVEAVEEDLKELKQVVGEKKRESLKDEVLQNLAKSEFKGDIEYLVGRFQEGTREWVFNKVQDWLDDRNSPNRVMVISANAGMGKSVISAVVCKRMQEAGRLSGSHFCQHNNARYRNPQMMLQSLAYHLCHALPEYKQALMEQLSRNLGKDLNNMGVQELFALLFKEPLSTVADPGRNMLMVIDALDESEYYGRNELLDVIADHFCKLPVWIRFLVTTRPERDIAKTLKHLHPFQLESNDEKNVEDVKMFFEKRLQHTVKLGEVRDIVGKLTEKSEGLMLYAYFLVSFIEENASVLDQGDLDGSLPLAISSVYHSYFKRLENELIKELEVKEENFLNLLCAVTASREPLPIDFVSDILIPDANSLVARRKVLKAIGSLSSFLPIRNGCLHIIHKSVKDWLTDTSCYGEHDFTVDEKEGHRILASFCSDELDGLKQKGVHDFPFSTTESYALHHGIQHLFQLDKDVRSCSLEECVQTYLMDLEILYAKLCMNDSIAAEDVLWLQRQEIFHTLSESCKGVLNTLLFLFRKHYSTFSGHPHVFFQTVLNEGGHELSPVASNLLQNKYPEIPYMEYVHKQMQQGAVQARFNCSSEVRCFDVSPQLDYMVCECDDGTIQLWSLHTGKLVWTRPIVIKRNINNGTWRKVPSSSALTLYRSVVFHPTAGIVLPGVLSHAYATDGELKPLFPDSNCSFTVCSVSGSKESILTDCPDNAKCIIMWSLINGSEISRTTRHRNVLSFAWSRDGRLLAVSHSGGSICLVDVVDGFRTLAEMNTSEECGMIKFSPDQRSLFCRGSSRQDEFLFRLNVDKESDGTFSLYLFYDRVSYEPWKSESRSEGGFLLGDPLFCVFSGFLIKKEAFAFVLNKQSVLMSYPDKDAIYMLDVNELTRERKAPRASTSLKTIANIQKIAFSLNGETVYVLTSTGTVRETVCALDITSGELKTEKRLCSYSSNCLVPVRNGVFLLTRDRVPELWNIQLSKCVLRWPDAYTQQAIPLSEHRVACVHHGRKVTFLDTTSRDIISTVQINPWSLVACNSKCQLITINEPHSLHLSDGKVILWCNKDFPTIVSGRMYVNYGLFSPSEEFVVFSYRGVNVLDGASGKTLHKFCRYNTNVQYKFFSDEICAIGSKASGRQFLQLFNVRSGDQLTVLGMESEVICLDSCPTKNLIAIGLKESTSNFKLIQVKLARDKGSKKIPRMINTPENEESSRSKRMTPETEESSGMQSVTHSPETEENIGIKRLDIRRVTHTPENEESNEKKRMSHLPETEEGSGIQRVTHTPETEESSGIKRLDIRRVTHTPENEESSEKKRIANKPVVRQRKDKKKCLLQ